jgi:hypothetical protein
MPFCPVRRTPGSSLAKRENEMAKHYSNESEIEAVVRGFETCTTDKDGFPHRDHLGVAVWYLSSSNETEAAANMRASLNRFLDHHDCRKNYHETLTLFWIKIVHDALERLGPELSRLEKTNAIIDRLGDSRLVFEFYSKEAVESDAARQTWIEPDLKELEV